MSITPETRPAPEPAATAELSAADREEMLRRSWMANDGLWFYQTAKALGIDAANTANAQVVREFARQEIRRLMNGLGVDQVRTLEQYHELYLRATDLYLGSLFEAEDSVDGDTHEIRVTTCFAYRGVKRAGIDKQYHCGPGERLTGWLQGMGLPGARIEPAVGPCQMAHTGSCSYRITVDPPPTS
jgi:hypothetical protein